jgi:3-oxoisoapionate kinase
MENVGKLLYTYYSDDFTGSTDALEALALHGLPAVLFLKMPDAQTRQNFAHCLAFGVAGESRSRTPQWMDEHLPPIFTQMREWGAPVNHYKVCSTFDSSPQIGSIGHAMELGRAAFAAKITPIVVGAPHLGRTLVYSNLFADAGGRIYRIDRHPTMSRHPVTPMYEADLRLHLAQQTSLRIGVVDLKAFQQGTIIACFDALLADGAEAILFDGVDEAMLDETAQLLCEPIIQKPLFAVGSSGLTYGLLRHWQKLGLIGSAPEFAQHCAIDQLLVLSGSCSPITERQIRHAERHGFTTLHLKERDAWRVQFQLAYEALAQGKSVVLYTALGMPDRDACYGEGFSAALGEELRRLLLLSGVHRVVIAGGDTSTHVVRQLGLTALTFVAPLTPGAPLCRAYAPDEAIDGLELVLKGGQIGPENFFAQVRDGH